MIKPKIHILLFLVLWFLTSIAGFWFLTVAAPAETSPTRFILLYILFSLWIFSLMSLLGYLFRIVFWRSGVRYEFLRASRRQGVLFGLIAVITLILRSFNIFNLLTGALLVLAFFLIEFSISNYHAN